VVFNAAYAENNLAVRILPLRQWLNVAPTAGRIHAGQSMNLDVQINALGLNGGTYEGTIHVLSNDPDENPLGVPVTLNVTGAPDIAVNPAALDYGTIFAGAAPTRNLTVLNPGTDDLINTAIDSGDPTVSASPSSFTVPAQGAQGVTVTWASVAPGALATALTIHSNDPDQPTVNVPVTGEAVPAPSFATNPESFSVALLSNTSTTRNLRISNTGGSDFVFTAEAEEITPTGTVTVYGEEDVIEVEKGEEDVQFGITPDASGGPDGFGYTWNDSNEPNGPAFDWVDISVIGTPITALTGDDQNAGPIPIGFDFPFYENSFTSLRVCTNGFLSFTHTGTQFSNTAIPNTSTGTPRNLLAPFWDDLHFRSVQRARYHNDGSRFIVQFTGVDRVPSGSNLTFQVILYPNGTIVYQYLTMTGVLNSATIGIQNATGTDGLQVVFNAPYVGNNLAIQFRPPAKFLTVNPGAGTVPPGGFMDLTVGFDAEGLLGGEYLGRVRIAGNDPILPQKDIPAQLVVTGVPDIAAAPASIDFGDVFIGFPQLRQLSVQNVGTDVLNVSDIVMTHPAFGVDQVNFSVPPGGSALLFVSFTPPGTGPQSGAAVIQSNDPDTPDLVVNLSGTGLVAPDIALTPGAIHETLPIPGTSTQVMRIDNTGGSDLNFLIGTNLTAGDDVQVHEAIELAKDEADPRPGLLGSGGPDAFGYRWIDSDEPGGPVFDWVDITGIGVPISLGDDATIANIPIGFNFPFYGNTFSTVNICSNGFLSFTSTSTALTNQPLPNTGAPENLLAVFWDDLNPAGQPRIYRYSDGTRFIVSYVGVPRFSSGGPYTFQVILYASGRIVYQFLDMQGTRLNEATIGIQNAARNDGLTIVHNANYAHNNLAISIATTPEYMIVTPTAGTIPAGGFADIQVSFDTNGLFGGTYHGSLRVSSNDPDEGVLTVPTTLVAVGTPHVAADPAALDFGSVYLSLSADRDVTIRNVGTDVLTVTGAGIANPDYSIVSTPAFPLNLGQGGSFAMTVRFEPSAACDPCDADLAIASNDPDDPTLAVPLTGVALVPPEIEVDPATVRAALATTLGPTAIAATKQLVISNTGGSDLHWTVSALSAVPHAVADHGLEAEAGKEAPFDPGPPQVLASGGPDAFGYRWTDSNEPGGPAFGWVDITGIGTPIALGDDATVTGIPIGFDFPFYGNTFGTVNICSNGFLSFTSASTALTNLALPSGSAPENLLAAFWDDLNPAGVPRIYHHTDGTRFIVSYVGVPRFSSGGPYTFQVVLWSNGAIDYQYLDMQGTRLNEATIGIQNATRDIGLTVVHNAAYVQNNLRIRFTRAPDWLTVAPLAGTTPAGGSSIVDVGFDATDLEDGDYQGLIRITSNDLTDPVVDVPALLHVGVETAALNINPNTLNQSSNGRWVQAQVTPPAGHSPQAIRTSSVLLQRTVPVAADGPVAYTPARAHYMFHRDQLLAQLPDGASVPVEVIGEVADVTWFAGWDHVRVLRPKSKLALGDIVDAGPVAFQMDELMLLEWEDPVGHPVSSYEVWYTADGGNNWEALVTGLTERQYLWRITGAPTDAGILEIVAVDDLGPMGAVRTDMFAVTGRTAMAEPVSLPEQVALRFASANPARGHARLELALPKAGPVDVTVHDIRGAVVARLAGGTFEAGRHMLRWDGRVSGGPTASPGMYFVRGQAGGQTFMIRFALVR
jgi:hypothetical protein